MHGTPSKVILTRANEDIHKRLDYICEVYASNRQQTICRLIVDTYNLLQDKKNFNQNSIS
jgi:hypothetical protein